MRLRLVHLYPDLMNLYGDRGNIITLERRCAWRGIELAIQELTLGGRLDPSQADLIFFGGGQDSEQAAVSRDLAHGVGEEIEAAVEDGAALLSVCGGYQLLGQCFRTRDGEEIPGLGVFDAYTVAGPKRMVGDVIVESPICGEPLRLVGFENHSGQTFLGPGAQPLGRVLVGNGNNGADGTEGIRYRNAVGTYLHGPLLPKNPGLADWLIAAALRRKTGAATTLQPLDDRLEQQANSAVATRIGKTGTRRSSIH
ncbi:MAG: glutamine amidotransferase [Chloroflexi bacterium]|nr:glutamine amidotransferase [Chloroflexota bacterium]